MLLPKGIKPKRMKPKEKRAANTFERFHHDRLSKFPCVLTGKYGVELHHIKQFDRHPMAKKMGLKRIGARDHRWVAPLSVEAHKPPHGVHGIGLEDGFKEKYGIDLVKWAIEQWQISVELYNARA